MDKSSGKQHFTLHLSGWLLSTIMLLGNWNRSWTDLARHCDKCQKPVFHSNVGMERPGNVYLSQKSDKDENTPVNCKLSTENPVVVLCSINRTDL